MTGLSQKAGPVVLRRADRRRRRRAVARPRARSTCCSGSTSSPRRRRSTSRWPIAERTFAAVSTSVVPTAADGRRPARGRARTSPRRAPGSRAAHARRRLLRRAGARAGAVRRPHAGERDGARRGLAAGRDPGLAGRAAAGVRAQRRRASSRTSLAFDWGRAVVAAPDAVAARAGAGRDRAPSSSRPERALVDRLAPAEGELRRLLEIRVPDLVGWGGRGAAERYADALERRRARSGDERADRGRRPRPAQADRLQGRVRGRAPAPRRAARPARGREGQVPPAPAGAAGARAWIASCELGAWFVPAFRMLRAGRRLRGTALDPFGRAAVRRVERRAAGRVPRAGRACRAPAGRRRRSPSPSCPTSSAATRTSSSPASSASASAASELLRTSSPTA